MKKFNRQPWILSSDNKWKQRQVCVEVWVRVCEATTTLVRALQPIEFDFRNISREEKLDFVQHLNDISKTFSKKRKKT